LRAVAPRGRFSNLMKNIREMVEKNPDSWMIIDQQRMLFERKKARRDEGYLIF
jgi:hypothetical protein